MLVVRNGCLGYRFAQWQKLLESSTEQSAGVHDAMSSDDRALAISVEVLSGKGCWGPLERRPLGTKVTPTKWLILVAPPPSSLFLAISTRLNFSSLWVGLNQRGSFMQCLERLGKLVVYPILSAFPSKGNFWAGESSRGAEQCWPGGWDDAGRINLFLLPFLWDDSQVSFSSAALLKLLEWAPELPHSYFCSWIAV